MYLTRHGFEAYCFVKIEIFGLDFLLKIGGKDSPHCQLRLFLGAFASPISRWYLNLHGKPRSMRPYRSSFYRNSTPAIGRIRIMWLQPPFFELV